jgi:hypothetical protein
MIVTSTQFARDTRTGSIKTRVRMHFILNLFNSVQIQKMISRNKMAREKD